MSLKFVIKRKVDGRYMATDKDGKVVWTDESEARVYDRANDSPEYLLQVAEKNFGRQFEVEDLL